ncbi:type I-B CRISPR-associated protein Cas7/Cst2/DevR [Thermodesulfovibrionales bacterium]|nr:type I-B CRISPR-associated protein Cas7/Cst2/DevR [Thermodesulfovibrionales bacterium]
MKNAKVLTITYLTSVSFASLNGSDKEADNISNIKKITRETDQFPYVSAQAVRRALRDQLAVLGRPLSEGVTATIKKGAATTQQDPGKFIDDDLFGFMGTEEAKEGKKGKSITRTSPLRVSPLISLQKYEGDLDFATNFMGVEAGGDPNIFETEIHSGFYRGTILIELDRVGCGEGFKKKLENTEKAARLKDFLIAFKNLWTSGRQTRFLADISPKFVASTMLTTKNPIFLESVIPVNSGINIELLNETVQDYKSEIKTLVFGARKGLFSNLPDGTVSIGDAFDTMMNWVNEYYK